MIKVARTLETIRALKLRVEIPGGLLASSFMIVGN